MPSPLVKRIESDDPVRNWIALPRVAARRAVTIDARLARLLLFGAATLLVLVGWGYSFGIYDQSIHLPFMQKFADATLYPGDTFMELRWQHFSYFWFLFIPFYRLGVLEPGLFVTHAVATLFTFWGIWVLSETLFRHRLAAVLSIALLVLPHAALGGWTLFEFSLLNRTFVLPLLLFAITLYLKRRTVPAFALLGLAYDLHALSANFVLAMFLFDGARRWRAFGWRRIAASSTAFLVTASPVLLWKLSNSSSDLKISPEWFTLAAFGVYNSIYFSGSFPFLGVLTASGVSGFLLFAIAYRFAPPTPHARTLLNFMLALALIVIVHCAAVQWLPVNILIQAQLVRASVFAMLFALLYFGYYLAVSFQSHHGRIHSPFALGIACALPFLFVPVLAWGIDRYVRSTLIRWTATGALCLMTLLLAAQMNAALQVSSPGIQVYAPQSAWQETQLWARDHTPRDAMFITPPHLWSFHESDWRVFSERATVATITELPEVALVPSYTATFHERFAAIAPGALENMDGNPFHNRQVTAEAFYSMSDDALVRAGCRYGASYLVSEKPHTRAFEQVYENEAFVVYALPRKGTSCVRETTALTTGPGPAR